MRVELLAKHGQLARVLELVELQGGTVETSYAGWTVALVPPSVIDALVARDEIEYIRTPLLAEAQAVAGEGVAASGASAWHAAGVTGAGVKVAIIDVGFDGYQQAQATGDLPSSLVPVNVGACAGDEHGTAVAEIVHEMAPGARLYLLCGGTFAAFRAAVDYAIANGVEILNASLGWKNSSRGDGSGLDGTPDFAVAKARTSGILPVVAAGNAGEEHWSGPYSDPDANRFHNFSGLDETVTVTIPPGQEACVHLKWDDWSAVMDDYDLYLYGSGLVPVAWSENAQGGDAGQTPTEDLCHTNPSGAVGTFHIAIFNFDASVTPRFDLFVWPDAIEQQYSVPAGSLLEPGSSPSALSVGALCWQSNALEPYSARGPTIDGRVEPDLSGQSVVSNLSYGPFNACGAGATSGFSGTSAAAPHVTGAAALVKQANPSFGPDQIQAFLEGRAGDLGTAGRDTLFGAGGLLLGAAPGASEPQPLPQPPSQPPPPPPSLPVPPPQPEPGDVRKPTARALVSSGVYGRLVRLRYHVSDNSGSTRELIQVLRRRSVLKQIRTKFGPTGPSGQVYFVRWRAPRKSAARGPLRFCVRAFDRAGNRSGLSCAAIRLRG